MNNTSVKHFVAIGVFNNSLDFSVSHSWAARIDAVNKNKARAQRKYIKNSIIKEAFS